MNNKETDLQSSWWLLARNLALAVGLGIAGYFLVQSKEVLLLLLGGGMLLVAPIMALTPVFSGLPGRGQCPECGASIETSTANDHDLLCGKCNVYLDAGGGKLRNSDPVRIVPQPIYAAPTPWDDLALIVFPTVAFSAQDKIQEMLTTRNAGTRVMEPHWPDGCCVCGEAATRFDNLAQKIAKPGVVTDSEINLILSNVPYCDRHKDGVRFDRVSSATPGAQKSFGVKFRSLAYRNRFMNLNPWKFIWGDN